MKMILVSIFTPYSLKFSKFIFSLVILFLYWKDFSLVLKLSFRIILYITSLYFTLYNTVYIVVLYNTISSLAYIVIELFTLSLQLFILVRIKWRIFLFRPVFRTELICFLCGFCYNFCLPTCLILSVYLCYFFVRIVRILVFFILSSFFCGSFCFFQNIITIFKVQCHFHIVNTYRYIVILLIMETHLSWYPLRFLCVSLCNYNYYYPLKLCSKNHILVYTF